MRTYYKGTSPLKFDPDGNGYFMHGEVKHKLGEFMRISEAPEPYQDYHGVASITNTGVMLVKLDPDDVEDRQVYYAVVSTTLEPDE